MLSLTTLFFKVFMLVTLFYRVPSVLCFSFTGFFSAMFVFLMFSIRPPQCCPPFVRSAPLSQRIAESIFLRLYVSPPQIFSVYEIRNLSYSFWSFFFLR